jgi:hypothetical protein
MLLPSVRNAVMQSKAIKASVSPYSTRLWPGMHCLSMGFRFLNVQSSLAGSFMHAGIGKKGH